MSRLRSRIHISPSLPRLGFQVQIEKGEHVRLPATDPKEGKVVPFVRCVANCRINLQPMRFAELRQSCVECGARRRGVVVRGVNEERRYPDVMRGGKETSSQFRRSGSVRACASAIDPTPTDARNAIATIRQTIMRR